MNTTYDDVIAEIVQSIYATMLGFELIRSGDASPEDHESLLASIQIAGEWTGGIVISLSPEMARASAAALLAAPANDVSESDMKDVAAELVNMIGGNVKALLPGPSHLSLPTIVSGHDFGLQMHHAQLIDDVVLAAETGALRVRLFAKKD